MSTRAIAVQRFDGGAGHEPYWQTYTVDLADNQTLLDALLFIVDHLDPTLAFRRTCRSGICGSCAARVNGVACLLCQRSLGEAVAGRGDAPLRVQPLHGFTVLRDLVVDMEPFFDAFDRAGTWLEPNAAYDGALDATTAERLWPAMGCVTCGICARTPASRAPHAAVVARLLTLAHDPRDAAGAARLHALTPSPDQPFATWLRAICPKAVDVGGLVE